MKVRVLFFARLREQLGSAGEEVELAAGVSTVAQLRGQLAARGAAWSEALSASGNRAVRAAVNHDMAGPDAVLAEGDEVAFFPPVTGG
jgi:molybdopterin synthase sulfur carrier subunit